MQGLLRFFFSLLENYRTFTTSCLKKNKKKKRIKTLIFLNAYIHWIQYLARSKLLHQHEREKLVHAGARFDLLFLIQKLQDLTSFCSKLFKRFLCLKCSTTLSVSTSQYWKHLARSKIFHPYPRQNLVHAGAPFFLLFLIGKLQDLTSSSREII